MSYQVLARKWRPGRFSELVGQEHVVAAIANALDNNRLHHAYLFTGTRGVGKTTIARIFSKSLNCEQGQGSNPCGECATCKEIEHGNYVDLLEIDAASRTKVEDTRELLDNVQYKPTRGRYKVYLIDEVHMLSKHSFNALLKTLEEPPPHVKFLLATTDPQKLPITILSRCLQFNLKALSLEQIGQQLQYILQQEQVSFEEPALGLLARAAQGSMRDALSLTDQAIAQGDNHVLKHIVTDMLGLMDKHLLVRLLYAVAQKNSTEVLGLVAQMAEQAPDYSQVLAELSSLLHQIALTQWVPDACKLETTAAKATYSLAKQMSAEQVQLLYQIALQGRKDMPYAVDGKSALEMTLLRMMSFAPAAPVEDPEKLISESSPVTTPSESLARQKATDDNSPAQPEVLGSSDGSPVAYNEDDEAAELLAQQAESEQAQIEQQASAYRGDEAAPDTMDDSSSSLLSTESTPDGFLPSSEPHGDLSGQPQDLASDATSITPESSQNEASRPVAESSNTNSMQEMLALRQKLKRSRQEDTSSEKKSEPVDPAARLSRAERPPSVEPVKSQPEPSPALSTKISKTPDSEPADTANNFFDDPQNSYEDVPPWVTESMPEAGQTQQQPPIADAEESSSVDSALHGDTASSFVDEASVPGRAIEDTLDSVAADVSDISDQSAVEGSVPASIDTDEKLSAYLPDGSKLVDANQIDSWSRLISSMPVAGLVKQIVLHSAYQKKDNQVMLELDPGQTHLLNDNSKEQVAQALSNALGEQIQLDIKIGKPDKTPFSIQQKINLMRQQHAEWVVSNDEQFQDLIGSFNASVIAQSVKAR